MVKVVVNDTFINLSHNYKTKVTRNLKFTTFINDILLHTLRKLKKDNF